MEKIKEQNNKRRIVSILVLATVFLMISTVTAVPYTQGDGIRKSYDAQKSIEKVLNSWAFKKLKNTVEPVFNEIYSEDEGAYIKEQLSKNVLSSIPILKGDPLYPSLVEILNALSAVLMVFFGHNTAGMFLAMSSTLALLAVASTIIGIVQAPVFYGVGVGIIRDAIREIVDEDFIYQYGTLGAIIFYCAISPIVFLLLIGLIPFSAVLGAVIVFSDTIQYLNFGENTPSDAVDNNDLVWTTGGAAYWFWQSQTYYYDNDSAQSGKIYAGQVSWINTTVTGPIKLKFYWKVSSEVGYDSLRFIIDGNEQTRISGSVDWQEQSCDIGAGAHKLMWIYTKNPHGSEGSDCGWLDYVRVIPQI